MAKSTKGEGDVIAFVRSTREQCATNTDIAKAFNWGQVATTRGLERLVKRGLLIHVLERGDGTHPHLYAAPL